MAHDGRCEFGACLVRAVVFTRIWSGVVLELAKSLLQDLLPTCGSTFCGFRFYFVVLELSWELARNCRFLSAAMGQESSRYM